MQILILRSHQGNFKVSGEKKLPLFAQVGKKFGHESCYPTFKNHAGPDFFPFDQLLSEQVK